MTSLHSLHVLVQTTSRYHDHFPALTDCWVTFGLLVGGRAAVPGAGSTALFAASAKAAPRLLNGRGACAADGFATGGVATGGVATGAAALGGVAAFT